MCDLFQGRAREANDAFAIAQTMERAADGTQRFVLPGRRSGARTRWRDAARRASR